MTLTRVSSRPRLCSFDTFDATCDIPVLVEDTFVVDIQTNKRKRHLIPCEPSPNAVTAVLPSKSSNGSLLASILPDDAQQCLLEFLDTETLRAVSQVGHFYRNLVSRNVMLWKLQLQRQWPRLVAQDDRVSIEDVHYYCDKDATGPPRHYCSLLRLAADMPTDIDRQMLERGHHRALRSRILSIPTQLQLVHLNNGGVAVQFTGRIGQGDRCVRAHLPLPRCAYRKEQTRRTLFYPRKQTLHHWRPIVAPYYAQLGVLDLTPRHVVYFEVTLSRPDEEEQSTNRPSSSQECIAVGLATADFSFHSRMPGWDKLSFGYHSDDGGIFHGKGHMLRNYGPGFGAGDTVGLGLDYQKQAVFYTLNGKFLGYAFENMDKGLLQQSLYPVVGMDTHCLVECDFVGPFRYDFAGHLAKQRADVR